MRFSTMLTLFHYGWSRMKLNCFKSQTKSKTCDVTHRKRKAKKRHTHTCRLAEDWEKLYHFCHANKYNNTNHISIMNQKFCWISYRFYGRFKYEVESNHDWKKWTKARENNNIEELFEKVEVMCGRSNDQTKAKHK